MPYLQIAFRHLVHCVHAEWNNGKYPGLLGVSFVVKGKVLCLAEHFSSKSGEGIQADASNLSASCGKKH